jgi:hypothetical protein
MANLKLYLKFDYTDADGNVYSDGSILTAKTISIDSGEIFDRTYSLASGTGSDNLGSEIMNNTKLSDFDFLWIESDQSGEIQIVCNEGGTLANDNIENGFVLGVSAGIPIIFTNDDSRNMGNMAGTFNEANHQDEIDNWVADWSADTIDRISWYHTTGSTAKVRVFAIT